MPAVRAVDQWLIVFAKYPTPGKVKTRLAPVLGKRNAAQLYRCFVETILSRTQSRSYQQVVFYSPHKSKKSFTRWLNGYQLQAQQGKNLGQRLRAAFDYAFRHGARRVVIIGSDSPLITKAVIRRAFRLLQQRECVVGPAGDGGYYLIGLSQVIPQLFSNISWGTDKVFTQTTQKIKKRRLRVSFLPEHFDVDDEVSFNFLCDQLRTLKKKESPALWMLKKMAHEVLARIKKVSS